MARKTIASLEEEIRVLNRQLDEISKANTRLINEKAKLIEAEDNTFQNSCLYAQMKKEIDYLNLRVKTKEGILETRNKKIDKQALLIQELLKENEELKNNNVHKDIEQNNNEELQEKLNRAIQRNKAIISDYAKCSKENEQLKMYIKELEVKQIGRPKRIDDNIVQKVIELREAKKSIREIAKELNISLGSVHKVIEQNKKQ